MKYSHLLPHFLKVIKQLKRDGETLSDEAAALSSSSHKPEYRIKNVQRRRSDVQTALTYLTRLAINQTNDLLNAVDPRDELEGGACWGVTLDVRLGSAVHRVKDD